MTNIALLEADQPAIAAEGPAEADVAAIPAPGAVIAVDGEQSVALATVEPPQAVAAVEGAQLLGVALVEDDPGMAAAGIPFGVMVAVSPAPETTASVDSFLTIAALPITTSRPGISRVAQLVTDLGLSDGLTVAATI
jgi:hypothetical protein